MPGGSVELAPLSKNYPVKVALVLLALCPYIVVTTAATLMQQPIMKDLHTSKLALEMASGLANAGYAFGAVLAALLAKKLRPRKLLLAYEAFFVAGSIVVATAPDAALFTTGRVAQGMATGLMLVAALPPLVTQFGVEKLPFTVAVVDIGLFGATTVGPLVGGDVGAHGSWRLLFWGLAALGAIGFVLQNMAVQSIDPIQPDAAYDPIAIGLAAVATVLPFFAASELTTQPFISWLVMPEMLIGVVALVTLVWFEYRNNDAVTPVKLVASAVPVVGILIAMVTGAAAVSLLELAEELAEQGFGDKPLTTGLLFWPQVVAVVLAAAAFGAVFKSRHNSTLIIFGTLVLCGGAVLVGITEYTTGRASVMLVAAAVGFGAGSTVSPGLFLAALAVPSSQLGPTFALVELLRSEAAFIVGPILLHVSLWHGQKKAALYHGISVGGWVVLGILVAGLAGSMLLWRASGARSQVPDLEKWLEDGEEGLDSPPALATVR